MPIEDDAPSFAPAKSNSDSFSPLERAEEAKAALAAWIDEHPVITTEDQAREAKLVFDRAQAALADLEDAREAETKPLHTAWQDAIARFKPTIETFSKHVVTLRGMMQAFIRKERERKEAEAAEAERKRQEAIRIAREAEEREREARENASMGEIGAGVVQATEDADKAFAEAQRAEREAARAVRDTNVRIGGGFSGRAMGFRAEKTQHVDDAFAAIKDMGVTEDIKAAIIKSARAFKKLNNRWPAGIREELQ